MLKKIDACKRMLQASNNLYPPIGVGLVGQQEQYSSGTPLNIQIFLLFASVVHHSPGQPLVSSAKTLSKGTKVKNNAAINVKQDNKNNFFIIK
ncbi:MAG: hypothetical protein WC699_12945 [Bacteroidales bacterium]